MLNEITLYEMGHFVCAACGFMVWAHGRYGSGFGAAIYGQGDVFELQSSCGKTERTEPHFCPPHFV